MAGIARHMNKAGTRKFPSASQMAKDEAKEPKKRTVAQEAKESPAYQRREQRMGTERHPAAARAALKRQRGK